MPASNERETPREAVRRRLREDLGEADPADVRSAVFCAEMGCGEREQRYLIEHPTLGCPYMNRVDEARRHCDRLRHEYREAIDHG